MSEPMEKIVEPVTADVSAQRIARVYAEALYRSAEERGQVAEIVEEMSSLIDDVFGADPTLEMNLPVGTVGRDRKTAILQKTFAGRSSELLLNFLIVLSNHDRLPLLRAIRHALTELHEERSGQVPVDVRSSAPLTEPQLERIRNEVRESFGREPLLRTAVDPDLIGGLTVQVGDWLFDATVRTQLDTFRNQLIERSSHAIQSGRDRFSSES
jgi:ATP synthase F1 delta subunit